MKFGRLMGCVRGGVATSPGTSRSQRVVSSTLHGNAQAESRTLLDDVGDGMHVLEVRDNHVGHEFVNPLVESLRAVHVKVYVDFVFASVEADSTCPDAFQSVVKLARHVRARRRRRRRRHVVLLRDMFDIFQALFDPDKSFRLVFPLRDVDVLAALHFVDDKLSRRCEHAKRLTRSCT